ncbi:unnamed protein product, partial [Ilex paraguariensis]
LVEFKIGGSQGPSDKKKKYGGGRKDKARTSKDAKKTDRNKKKNVADSNKLDNCQKKK